MKKKVLVSGIQSSGRIHIGNYFGAMKQNIDLPNNSDFDSYIFIADYHSMTSLTNASERRKSSFDLACAYLACGLDTEKVALFKQSDVPEHTELSWILSTITPMRMLELAHSYKDKKAKSLIEINNNNADYARFLNKIKNLSENDLLELSKLEGWNAIKESQQNNIKVSEFRFLIFAFLNLAPSNVGLFTYPVLMAADILMYQADIVPVGKDQAQHVEMTREIGGKFNRAYGQDFFKMPQAYIKKEVEIVPGTDGEKMSKSKGNVIPLFGTDEEIRKAVMSIVTDAKSPSDVVNPDENNIYNIHKLFLSNSENSESGNSDIEDLRNRFLKVGKYEGGSYSYKEAKESLYEAIIAFVSPMCERYDYYQSHPDEVYAILEKGKVNAQAKARETMSEVRKIVGLDN